MNQYVFDELYLDPEFLVVLFASRRAQRLRYGDGVG